MTPPSRKRRPSASLLISALALFVALGGTGIAQDVVGEISAKISGKRIAKNAIKSKHIKNGKVKAVDIEPGVVPDAYSKGESDGKYQAKGDYLAANGKAADSELLDGKDSTEFLGKTEKAADSDRLDNLDSSAFVVGEMLSDRASTASNVGYFNLLSPPGAPTLQVRCTADVPEARLVTPTGTTSYNEAYRIITSTAGLDFRQPFNSASAELNGAATQLQFVVADRSGSLVFSSDTVTEYHVVQVSEGAGAGCAFAAWASQSSSSNSLIFVPLKK